MRFELRIEGRVIVIEAEGAVSVAVRDDVPAAVTPVAPALHVVSVPDAADDFFKPDVPVDDGLFRKLSDLRKELAVASKVPPYVVFHDKTLREMIERMPLDLASLGAIPGVGQSKLEKYGEKFLSVIKGA